MREQAPNEAEVIPFLKRPETSSHGSTLGLCNRLHGMRRYSTFQPIGAVVE
jgi:hypothetical protein